MKKDQFGFSRMLILVAVAGFVLGLPGTAASQNRKPAKPAGSPVPVPLKTVNMPFAAAKPSPL